MPRRLFLTTLLLSVALAAGCDGNTPTRTPLAVVTDLVFLTQSEPQATNMDALYVGRVFVDEKRCIRLDGDRATVIWPAGFTVRQDGESIRVIDNVGRDLGSLGESFSISGGEVNQLNPELHISYMDRAMAHESCPGKYWIAAGVR
jgi:hypothetical protein